MADWISANWISLVACVAATVACIATIWQLKLARDTFLAERIRNLYFFAVESEKLFTKYTIGQDELSSYINKSYRLTYYSSYVTRPSSSFLVNQKLANAAEDARKSIFSLRSKFKEDVDSCKKNGVSRKISQDDLKKTQEVVIQIRNILNGLEE